MKQYLSYKNSREGYAYTKIFSEETEITNEFIIKGVCLGCDLELTEEDIKSLEIKI